MIVQQAYLKCIHLFTKKDFISSPEIEARILICYILKIDYNDFICYKDELQIDYKQLLPLIDKRLSGKSIAAIINKKDFYDIQLLVDDNVLIPRPETEILVEKILEIFKSDPELQALDIGTGSGVISLVLIKHLKNTKIDAIDISRDALKIAKINVKKNHLPENRINFIYANFFEYEPAYKYDIIISNPPYIPVSEVRKLLATKIVADPHIALDGGENGLNFYEHIKKFADKFLKKGGYIFLEHGYKQKKDLLNIFCKNNIYKITTFKDLAGDDRVMVLKS